MTMAFYKCNNETMENKMQYTDEKPCFEGTGTSKLLLSRCVVLRNLEHLGPPALPI